MRNNVQKHQFWAFRDILVIAHLPCVEGASAPSFGAASAFLVRNIVLTMQVTTPILVLDWVRRPE